MHADHRGRLPEAEQERRDHDRGAGEGLEARVDREGDVPEDGHRDEDMIRTYVRCMCDAASHSRSTITLVADRYFLLREPPPGRLRDRRARPRPLARQRGRGDPRGAGPDRRGRAARRKAQRADRPRRRAEPGRGPSTTSRAAASSSRTRSTRWASTSPDATAWTSAPPPAGSRTACSSVVRPRVIALDVAHGQLDWGLRKDERVHVIERMNAREIEPGDLPFRAVAGDGRRLVHLARQGPAGGGRCARGRTRRPAGDGEAAVRARAESG